MTKEIELKKKQGYKPYVMSPEEALEFFDRHGIQYEICDTPVPVLGNRVSCGVPSDTGEQVIEDYFYLPKSVVGLHLMVDVVAQGDSMIEADIHEGDMLQLEIGAEAHDGDIVVAEIEREYTAKVFFSDDKRQKWLLPKNQKYNAIALTDQKETRISGVVRNIVKKAPRVSYSECMDILNRSLAKKHQEGDVMLRLAKAAREGCHLFWAASAWAVAYCVVRDYCHYEGSMKEFERNAMNMVLPVAFKYECTKGTVQRTISNHPYMRLHVDKWKENGASIREIILAEFLKKFLL